MAKIFIAEDDQNLVRLMTTTFKSKGHEVVSFLNGTEAKAFIEDASQASSVQFLIFDRMLGDADGVDLVKLYRSKYGPNTPILLLTSLSAEKDVLQGLQAGANDYLCKPFSMDVVLQKVNQFLKC